MVSWETWQGDADTWDALLLEMPDYTVFQAHAWGRHRSHFAWQPTRLVAQDRGRVVAMAQVLVRRLRLGVAATWVPGGPVGAIGTWNAAFFRALRGVVGARHLYCRISPMREEHSTDVESLTAAGWRRPSAPMNTGLSLLYAPLESESDRITMAGRNWRKHLRKALRNGHAVSVWDTPDVDEMLSLYAAMQAYKGLPEQFNRATLLSMFEAVGSRCVLVRCDDVNGRLLALRGALVLGAKGWDAFAAASPEARKVGASYTAFWELMQQCASRGVALYDMSGADPIGNKGVYDFKKGTGARDYRYLGEWEWASSPLVRRVANMLIRRSGRLTY